MGFNKYIGISTVCCMFFLSSFPSTVAGLSLGEVKVVANNTTTQEIKVKALKGRVNRMPPLEGEIANYTTIARANIYGGPGTEYKLIGRLPEKSVVRGQKVKGTDWYAVFQGYVGTGFVAARLLKKTPTAAINADRPAGEVGKRQTTVERNCKTIETSVPRDDGTRKSEVLTLCQKPNGDWEVVK